MGAIDRRVLTVAACTICTAVILGVFLLVPIWSLDWMSEFKMNRAATMALFGGSGILMNVGMPVVGGLLVRTPAWRLVVFGGIMLGGGMILDSMIKAGGAFSAIYIVAVGVGVVFGGILPCQTLSVRLFPDRVGSIGGLLMVALAVAGAVFPMLLLPLKAAFGWRPVFAGVGAFVLVVVPLLAILFMRGEENEAVGGAAGLHGAPAGNGATSTRAILGSWAFWVLGIGILPLFGTPASIQANIMSILADHGVAQIAAGAPLAALAIGTAIGAGLFGWLADRIDPRVAIIMASLVTVVSLVLLASGQGVALQSAGAFFLGVGGGAISPLMSTFALRQFGDGYAPALGLLNFVMLPYMFGPPWIGHIRDQTGTYNGILYAMAPVVVIAASIMWSLRAAKSAPAPAVALQSAAGG